LRLCSAPARVSLDLRSCSPFGRTDSARPRWTSPFPSDHFVLCFSTGCLLAVFCLLPYARFFRLRPTHFFFDFPFGFCCSEKRLVDFEAVILFHTEGAFLDFTTYPCSCDVPLRQCAVAMCVGCVALQTLLLHRGPHEPDYEAGSVPPYRPCNEQDTKVKDITRIAPMNTASFSSAVPGPHPCTPPFPLACCAPSPSHSPYLPAYVSCPGPGILQKHSTFDPLPQLAIPERGTRDPC